MEWLTDDPLGQRIIHLTPQADIDTLMHELAHAASAEMHAFYPEEFTPVERLIGKPYNEWDADDHEQFVRWWTRYLADGHAPTPELVDAMGRMKTWMRSIYEGMRRLLGGRVPTETRVLFDTWLGAYDDDNVTRIAVNMGREGWGREDLDIQRWGGVAAITSEDLRTLRRRQETRRARQSVLGMKTELRDLERQLQELDEVVGPWTEKQHEKYLDLSARVLNGQAEIAVRTDKREQDLRAKLNSLEKALARGTDNRRFQGALTAMQWISDDRERILKEAFGDDFDAVFGDNFMARRDLLADWLVSRGLLEPHFKRGTAYYFPHTTEEPSTLPPQTPAAALTSRVVGQSKKAQLNLYKRNQMILWQRGDWTADPNVLVQAHLRAMGYAWMNHVKGQLWELGRPLTWEEAANLPSDVYLINLHGTPISMGLRRQVQGGSSTHDAQRVHDALLGTDNDVLETSLTDYWNNFALDSNKLPQGLDVKQTHFARRDDGTMISSEYRVVPKEAVHALLRPLRGSRTGPGVALDIGTTMSRFALIYANAPGYMLSNAVGNLGLLLMQQGPFQLARTVGLSSKLLSDRKLLDWIMGETGDLPAFAAISRGRGFDEPVFQKGMRYEKGYLNFISVVDRYPRAIAWMYEAKKLGYHSADDMRRLIKGADEKTRRDRETAQENATNHMIDFNLLSPWERQWLTRTLFIWPFVRGATKWPFWYAKNYPERAAFAANIGLTMEERRKRMWGGAVPGYAEGYFPISTTSDKRRAQIIQAGKFAPTTMAADEIRLVRDLLGSIMDREPNSQTLNIVDTMQPLLNDAIHVLTGKDQFGEDQTAWDTFTGDVLDHIVPWKRIIHGLLDPDRTPRAYLEDRGLQDRTLRTLVRINQQTVSIPWLRAQAQKHDDISTDERIAQEQAKVEKKWEELTKEPLPALFTRAATMRVVYDDRVKEYAREVQGSPEFEPTPMNEEKTKWNLKYTLTPYERAKILYEVVHFYLPASPWPRPEVLLNDPTVRAKPDSEIGKLLMNNYIESTSSTFLSPSTNIVSSAEAVEAAEKLAKEYYGGGR